MIVEVAVRLPVRISWAEHQYPGLHILMHVQSKPAVIRSSHVLAAWTTRSMRRWHYIRIYCAVLCPLRDIRSPIERQRTPSNALPTCLQSPASYRILFQRKSWVGPPRPIGPWQWPMGGITLPAMPCHNGRCHRTRSIVPSTERASRAHSTSTRADPRWKTGKLEA